MTPPEQSRIYRLTLAALATVVIVVILGACWIPAVAAVLR